MAYPSERLLTENHTRVLRDNGWLDNDRRFQIMDENPDDDISFTVEPHNKIDITYAGKHLESYDSCLVLAHFKGHGMGGFGGALKKIKYRICIYCWKNLDSFSRSIKRLSRIFQYHSFSRRFYCINGGCCICYC